jgi:toxin ParE1/3/4
LSLHPYLGRESAPGVRELVVHRHYLLTYRIKPGRIEILQVWHVAQQR